MTTPQKENGPASVAPDPSLGPNLTCEGKIMNAHACITSTAIPATEHPWTKARRLAKELSAAMRQCDDGRQYVEVFPAGTRDFPIMFGDRDYYESRSGPAYALRALIADFEAAEAERIALAAQYAAVQEKIQKALGGKLCPEWKIPDPNHAPAGIGRIPFSSCKEANERCDEAVRRFLAVRPGHRLLVSRLRAVGFGRRPFADHRRRCQTPPYDARRCRGRPAARHHGRTAGFEAENHRRRRHEEVSPDEVHERAETADGQRARPAEAAGRWRQGPRFLRGTIHFDGEAVGDAENVPCEMVSARQTDA